MRNTNLVVGLIIFLALSCKELHNTPDLFAPDNDTNQAFVREIPKYHNRVDLFYTLAKNKQNQLGLDSIEGGYSYFQVRIWYDYARVYIGKLLIITNNNTGWDAVVFNYKMNETDSIIFNESRQLQPKSGWETFSRTLIELKVISLPNQSEVSGYDGGADGASYHFEVATKKQYRFYGYWQPHDFKLEFWQANNVAQILDLIEVELGITWLHPLENHINN